MSFTKVITNNKYFMIQFRIGSYGGDSEKTILPTIVFINLMHPFFSPYRKKGFSLNFGWWHYCIAFTFLKKTYNPIENI